MGAPQEVSTEGGQRGYAGEEPAGFGDAPDADNDERADDEEADGMGGPDAGAVMAGGDNFDWVRIQVGL